MGKAIYMPKGKAAEYAKYACNFYTGCSNNCDYCYCKCGVMVHTWHFIPKIKKCFKDEAHAFEVFEKELKANLPELQKHGLFFTFTSDPLLPETKELTYKAVSLCIKNCVPVKLLTKRVDWIERIALSPKTADFSTDNYVAFGFTLTGSDELEPNASTNNERIEAMKKLHKAGFKVWASIEPIISLSKSRDMIFKTAAFCDLYKVGLLSGKQDISVNKTTLYYLIHDCGKFQNKFYFKDSLIAKAGINRKNLPDNCVPRDYNMFNQ